MSNSSTLQTFQNFLDDADLFGSLSQDYIFETIEDEAKHLYIKNHTTGLIKILQENSLKEEFYNWFIKQESRELKMTTDYWLILDKTNVPRKFLDFCIENIHPNSREFLVYVLVRNKTTPSDILENIAFEMKPDKNFVRDFELLFNNPSTLKTSKMLALGKLIRFYKDLQWSIKQTKPRDLEVLGQEAYETNLETLKTLRALIKDSGKKVDEAEFALIKLLY